MKQTKFILITGCAGAGKTTIGKKLIKKLNCVFVDKDTITRKFTDFILEFSGSNAGDRESDFYCTQVRPIEYEITINFCLENLKLGNSVMLIMPMTSYITDYNKFNELINIKELINSKISLKIIWINHNEELEYKRITKRNAERDKNKVLNWQKYIKGIKNIEPDTRLNAFRFDNSNDGITKKDLKKIVKYIKK